MSEQPAIKATGSRRFVTGVIGLEVEFPVTSNELASACRGLMGPLGSAIDVGYNHDVYSSWVVKSDSSCGSELVSPPTPIGELLPLLEEIFKLIRTYSRYTDPSAWMKCGVHVHVGVRRPEAPGLLERRLDRLWRAYDRRWGQVVDLFPHRNPITSAHCKRYCSRQLALGEKYGAVNVSHLMRGRMDTIEFRQGSSYSARFTKDQITADSMMSWINFCMNLVELSCHPVGEFDPELIDLTRLVDEVTSREDDRVSPLTAIRYASEIGTLDYPPAPVPVNPILAIAEDEDEDEYEDGDYDGDYDE